MILKYAIPALTGLSAVFFLSIAQANDEHHPEAPAQETAKDGAAMGAMKMDDMKGMMHECMEMHKSGKMCDHQTMEKCQANMGKAECAKMMTEAKATEKKAAKKK